MSIALSDVLFYGGGECVERFGTLSWRTSLDEDNAETHARTGSGATYVGRDGYLRKASANTPRVEWLDLDADGVYETPVYLGEAGGTNLITSDNFSSGWTSANSPVVTSSISDPAGGTGAYRIADDDGAAQERKYFIPTFTGDGVKAVVFVVREATMPASGGHHLSVYDQTAAAFRMQLAITAWSAGEPTVSAVTGTYLGKRAVGNGYWAIYGLTASVTAANENRVQVVPAYTAAQTGSIDIYRAAAFNATVPPSSILDASQVLGADSLYFPFPYKPMAMAVYVDLYERGAALASGTPRVLMVSSDSGGSDAWLGVLGFGTGEYRAIHDNGSQQSTSDSTTLSAAIGDRVELLVTLSAAGAVQIASAKAGGSPTSAPAGTARTLASAWAQSRLYLGSNGASNAGLNAFRSIKIARFMDTAPSMDDFRSLFA